VLSQLDFTRRSDYRAASGVSCLFLHEYDQDRAPESEVSANLPPPLLVPLLG
jgi:hypothetical protein